MRCLSRCRRTCDRNSAADSEVELLSNLISLIEFDWAEMRRTNRSSLKGKKPFIQEANQLISRKRAVYESVAKKPPNRQRLDSGKV